MGNIKGSRKKEAEMKVKSGFFKIMKKGASLR
jgi:hypothetical protein